MTFEFFKNYIFEKRRQFLNRNVGIPKMYLNMMENLKSAKRILSSPVSCTFGELMVKRFDVGRILLNCLALTFLVRGGKLAVWIL